MYEGFITKMLANLELLSLKERGSMNRLIFFYEVVEGLVPPIPPEDFLKPIRQKRHVRAKKNGYSAFIQIKWKCMRIGSSDVDLFTYKLKENDKGMELTQAEKDIGVVIHSKLSFENHINEKMNKANSVTGVIRRTF